LTFTVNDNLYDGKSGIGIETIFHYLELGFIPTPLGEDGKTPQASTKEISNKPWTLDTAKQNLHLFKNVATLLGKTHLKDTDGRDLYLNALDIEDKAVYDILASTLIKVEGKEQSLLDFFFKNTFVDQEEVGLSFLLVEP
jgi:hypothetical protein